MGNHLAMHRMAGGSLFGPPAAGSGFAGAFGGSPFGPPPYTRGNAFASIEPNGQNGNSTGGSFFSSSSSSFYTSAAPPPEGAEAIGDGKYNGGRGQFRGVSRSSYTAVDAQGRRETVTREVAEDGTETVRRRAPDGRESVTVNGVLQQQQQQQHLPAAPGGQQQQQILSASAMRYGYGADRRRAGAPGSADKPIVLDE